MRRGSRSLFAVLVGLALAGLGSTTGSAAELVLEKDHPTRGEEIEVRISGVDDPTTCILSAAYRPGSATEVSEAVGRFTADGVVRWSSQDAGLSTLSANSGDETVATRNVAVRFDSTPPLGVLILLVAGLLLFGGATVMLRRALEA